MLLRILAFAGGMLLGVFFFGGLWLTVKNSLTAKNTALLYLGSLILRTSITLIGFYYISFGNWQRLLITLIGFIAARFIIMRLTRPVDEEQVQLKRGAIHEVKS